MENARRDRLLRALFDRRPRWIELARSVLRCPMRAEDVVQDAAVRICQADLSAEVLDPERFLHRMVRNLAIDALRSIQRECRMAALHEAVAQPAHSCDCPFGKLGARQGLRCALKALQDAPPRSRQAFLAHRIDGLSQRDIAARLGVSATLVNFMIRDTTARCRQAVPA